MTQKLVFGCVGYAANFLSSLAPCACTMVARSRQKICAAALPNSQLLNHFRYILSSLSLDEIQLKYYPSTGFKKIEGMAMATRTIISCGDGVSVTRTIPVQQSTVRLTDHLGRTQEERRFVKHFDKVFNAASIGDLPACQKIVKKGFRDFNAYQLGKGKSLDNVSPLQIAKTNKHQHIVEYFNSQMNPGTESEEVYAEVDLKKSLLNGSPAQSEKSEEDDFNPEEFHDELSHKLTAVNAASSDDDSQPLPMRTTTTAPRRRNSSGLDKASYAYESIRIHQEHLEFLNQKMPTLNPRERSLYIKEAITNSFTAGELEDNRNQIIQLDTEKKQLEFLEVRSIQPFHGMNGNQKRMEMAALTDWIKTNPSV